MVIKLAILPCILCGLGEFFYFKIQKSMHLIKNNVSRTLDNKNSNNNNNNNNNRNNNNDDDDDDDDNNDNNDDNNDNNDNDNNDNNNDNENNNNDNNNIDLGAEHCDTYFKTES